jgi:hypothetical protein
MAEEQCTWQYSLAAQATACGQCASVAGSQPAPLGWSHLGPARSGTQSTDWIAYIGIGARVTAMPPPPGSSVRATERITEVIHTFLLPSPHHAQN